MKFEFPVARAAVASLAASLASLSHAAAGPSFDCARVTSQVNRTICASPELSALDRQLAEHYRELLARSGADAPALQREEAQWLREVRNPCPDAACIKQAYAVWDAVLLARTRRLASAPPGAAANPPALPVKPAAPASAAGPISRSSTIAASSPAAAAETQPFAVEPALLADARGLRGHACAPGEDVPQAAGFLPVPGALPVVSSDAVVLVRHHVGADFAFLLDTRHDACRIVDVVALPPHSQVGDLLQCMVPSSDGSTAPLSTGVGLRRPRQQAPLAYWEVDVTHGRFVRQPLGVLGWTEKLSCREPEFGD